MKKVLIVLIALAFMTGCWGSLNEQFVKAVDSNWSVMGPDYRSYIEKDAAIPEASKARRLKAIDEFTELVKEAKAKADE